SRSRSPYGHQSYEERSHSSRSSMMTGTETETIIVTVIAGGAEPQVLD
ncbi:hypothetical protein A2U01_0050779, partial [Trifolium medium]|nr:hypothetical protein [Trifolium medium]